MPESNVEPQEIKIKRQRVTEEGLKNTILVRWDITQETREEPGGETSTVYVYKEESYTLTVDDNKQGAKDYINNNARMMKLKAKAKAEARRGKGILTQTEKDGLRGNRAKAGKGN